MDVESKNFGADRAVHGIVRTVRRKKDLDKILSGDIVFFEKCTEDPLVMVVRAIDKGAAGFLGDLGRTHHGVIAAKELGRPFYFMAGPGIVEGITYTLANGMVREGHHEIPHEQKKTEANRIFTKKKVMINMGFPSRGIMENTALAQEADGVGFARIEFVILEILEGIHPIHYLLANSAKVLEDNIYEHFFSAVRAFTGKSFWIRTDDFSPRQLFTLDGGEQYEEGRFEELVGFRGIARAVDPRWLNLGSIEEKLEGISWIGIQMRAIARLCQTCPETRIGVFAPMVHDVNEFRTWRMLAEKELGKNAQYGVMVEVPSIAGEGIRPFLDERLISFMVIGSNDLTALTMGIDRNDPRLSHLFNEEHPSVMRLIKDTIRLCEENGVMTAIGGEAASRESMIETLFHAGISAFSVAPDRETIRRVREKISMLEHI